MRGDYIARGGRFAPAVIDGETPPADEPGGLYHTEGPDFINRSGAVFAPRGFNIGGGTFANGGAWPDLAFNTTFRAGPATWGANTVRIVTYATNRYPWAVRQDPTGYGGQTGQGAVDALADALTVFWRAGKYVVIIECHDLTYPGFTPEQTEQVKAFWARYATRWGHDSAVWFNIANEPAMDDATEWRNFHDDALGRIRATAQNVAIVDAFGYAGDSGKDWQNNPLPRAFSPENAPWLNTKHGNVAIGWHNYGQGGVFTNQTNVNAYLTACRNAGVAMVCGELGVPKVQGEAGSGNYQRELDALTATTAAAPERGLGLIWWTLNHVDSYDVQALDGNLDPFPPGTALSPGGTLFKAYMDATITTP